MKLLLIGGLAAVALVSVIIWMRGQVAANTPWFKFQEAVYGAYPAAKKQFASGASEQDIERLKHRFPHDLPVEFIAMLMETNGGTGRHGANGIFFGAELLSVDGIIRELDSWQAIIDDGLEVFTDDYSSFPPDTIQPIYVDPDWLPFAGDGAGNFMALDFNPGPQGTVGQVISFGTDEIELLQIADSFPAFLQLVTGLVGHKQAEYDSATGKYSFPY